MVKLASYLVSKWVENFSQVTFIVHCYIARARQALGPSTFWSYLGKFTETFVRLLNF